MTFPISFHQLQTDTRTEPIILNSLCRYVEHVMRAYQTQFMNPSANQTEREKYKRCFITIKDLIDYHLSLDCPTYLLRSILSMVKTALIYEHWEISKEEKISICKKIIQIFKFTSDVECKRRCAEIFGTYLYKGHIELLEDLCK